MATSAPGEVAPGTTAARGALALIAGQAAFFVIGYLAVVVLARGLGPGDYGVYGVIISVLVWIEQSGRQAVQSAVAPLVAANPAETGSLACAALALSVGANLIAYAAFWLGAPWLAHWLGIDGATWFFRLAALDLPVFAVYAALQGIHQGHRRFYRIAGSNVVYASAKLIGFLLLVSAGLTITNALVLNIIVSAIGVLTLATSSGVSLPIGWRQGDLPRVATLAAPVGVYSVANLSASSLALWFLKALSRDPTGTTSGIFVAALNVARVPGFTMSVLGIVLLPSVARAVGLGDTRLARGYIRQAMRLFLLLYVPVCVILLRTPDALMRWIYSDNYGGGGMVLAILMIGQAGWTIQAILAWALVAAGESRRLAVTMAVTTALAIPLTFLFIVVAGANGAAAASGITGAAAAAVFGRMLYRRFGSLAPFWRMMRISLAGAAMLIVSFLSGEGWHPVLRAVVSFAVYAAVLVLLAEITWDDLSTITQPRPVSR